MDKARDDGTLPQLQGWALFVHRRSYYRRLTPIDSTYPVSIWAAGPAPTRTRLPAPVLPAAPRRVREKQESIDPHSAEGVEFLSTKPAATAWIKKAYGIRMCLFCYITVPVCATVLSYS